MNEHLQRQALASGGDEETGFELGADDPGRSSNRGRLQADISGDTAPSGAGRGADDAGTTGAGPRRTGDDVGATGSGRSTSSQLDLGTGGMVASDSGPAAAGPVEGGRSGATAPRVEVSDVGLVDAAVADITPPAEDATGGGRVEDENGNLL